MADVIKGRRKWREKRTSLTQGVRMHCDRWIRWCGLGANVLGCSEIALALFKTLRYYFHNHSIILVHLMPQGPNTSLLIQKRRAAIFRTVSLSCYPHLFYWAGYFVCSDGGGRRMLINGNDSPVSVSVSVACASSAIPTLLEGRTSFEVATPLSWVNWYKHS